MNLHDGDPFREERHYSRLAVAYGLMLVLLIGIGIWMYRAWSRQQPTEPTDHNSQIRQEFEAILDE